MIYDTEKNKFTKLSYVAHAVLAIIFLTYFGIQNGSSPVINQNKTLKLKALRDITVPALDTDVTDTWKNFVRNVYNDKKLTVTATNSQLATDYGSEVCAPLYRGVYSLFDYTVVIAWIITATIVLAGLAYLASVSLPENTVVKMFGDMWQGILALIWIVYEHTMFFVFFQSISLINENNYSPYTLGDEGAFKDMQHCMSIDWKKLGSNFETIPWGVLFFTFWWAFASILLTAVKWVYLLVFQKPTESDLNEKYVPVNPVPILIRTV